MGNIVISDRLRIPSWVDGRVKSRVFGKAFRLTQEPNEVTGPTFLLEMR